MVLIVHAQTSTDLFRMNFGTRWIKPVDDWLATRWLDDFKYESLPSSATFIRLLDIEDGNRSDIIRCSLRKVNLDANPDFDALSYSWQKDIFKDKQWGYLRVLLPSIPLFSAWAGRSKAIICNGGILFIQENLFDFLLRLREMKKDRSIWIDALCINQRDKEERSFQVVLMDKIYGSADTVLVWLGEPSKGSTTGMEFMAKLRNYDEWSSTSHQIAHGTRQEVWRLYQADYSAGYPTAAFFKREYFQRSWVVQELVLAKKLCFYIGSTEISSDVLLNGAMWVLTAGKYISLINRMLSADRTGYESVPYIFQARDKHRNGKLLSLQDYLSLCRGLRATDPRDKVFATLGVVDKTSLEVDLGMVGNPRIPRPESIRRPRCVECSLPLKRSLPHTSAKNLMDKALKIVGITNKTSVETEYYTAKATAMSRKPSTRSTPRRLKADYNKCVVCVYRECTGCLLNQTNLPHVLSLVGKTQNGVEGLPSWIPDYSVPLQPKPFSSLGCPDFRSTSSVPSDYRLSGNGRELHLSASQWDTIEKLGESYDAFHFYHLIKLQGHMLDLVSAIGKNYAPTGEETLSALRCTLTANLSYGSTTLPEEADEEFFEWLVETFSSAIALQQHPLGFLMMIISYIFQRAGTSLGGGGDPWFESGTQSLAAAIGARVGSKLGMGGDTGSDNGAQPRLETILCTAVPLHTINRYVLKKTPTGAGQKSSQEDQDSDELGSAILSLFRGSLSRKDTENNQDPRDPQDADKPQTEDQKIPVLQRSSFSAAFDAVYKHRRIFLTSKHYLGIGPSELKEGDKVMLVAGADQPFIFRSAAKGSEVVRLIGGSYIHGIMNGEALDSEDVNFKSVRVI
ncbi:hypothetical protein FQN54_007006 [Arachnomyces sp. PD_36]|nr:hypothetical protein FQN54_007006 [Arachnomyces sp. PD_36]